MENNGTFSENTQDAEVLQERKRVVLFGLPWSFTKYELGEEKLVVHTGLFTSVEDEILLYRIMDVSLRRTLGQKLFGLATIRLVSSDKTLPEVDLKNIRNYRRFKDTLSQRVARERLRMRTRTSEMMGLDGGPIESDSDDLDDWEN